MRRPPYAPPAPREHGAWVMLYVPLLLGFMVVGGAARVTAGAVALLAACVTFLFLAREAAALTLRRRLGRARNGAWAAVYAAGAAAAGAPLLARGHRGLLAVAAAAGILFLLHLALTLAPARKRLDRTVWGELLGVGALCLTAPAAWAAAGLWPGERAWLTWALCAGYFGSGVMVVKAILAAATLRRPLTCEDRRRVARAAAWYHAAVVIGLAAAAAWLGGWQGACAVVAFAPALARTVVRLRGLSHVLPNLLRVGMLEAALSAWFLAWAAAALR